MPGLSLSQMAPCGCWRLEALLASLLGLCIAARPATAAVPYTPAAWNSFTRYEAESVPAPLLFPGEAGADAGGPRMFPLDLGWDVEVRGAWTRKNEAALPPSASSKGGRCGG